MGLVILVLCAMNMRLGSRGLVGREVDRSFGELSVASTYVHSNKYK